MASASLIGLNRGDFPWFYVLSAVYVVIMIIIALTWHDKLPATSFGFALGLPIAVSCAFRALAFVINAPDGHGIVYFLFLLNFASIADMGAYFTGSAFGRHLLAPVISPKKTVEGAVGGMFLSIIFTIVFVLVFNRRYNTGLSLWQWILITPIFVLIGIAGDLFASYIKRSFKIKDYGKLIPGHGGILDRLDSILLIAPFFELYLVIAEVVA